MNIKNDVRHILIVDDDERIRSLLKTYLVRNQFFISDAHNADKAIYLFKRFDLDLIITDLMMPIINGYELTKKIRELSEVPIIMLTAISDNDDKIKSWESGINDYIAKPFEPKELLFRINNIFDRDRFISNKVRNFNFGEFEFDISKGNLFLNNKRINLTDSESKLLHILILNRNRIISREELSNLFDNVNERSIDVQIIRLRNKIENDAKHPYFLQTIRGKGYILYV